MAKIMLVEDDNNLREIYEARLQAEGYDIVAAHDGEEALVVAKAEKPDLIISDVMMPKISGFEMLDILRNTDGLKDVKVIMLTALGQSDDQQRADRLGADRYLVKSQVTLEDIVKVAQHLLQADAPIGDVTGAAAIAAIGTADPTVAPAEPAQPAPQPEPIVTPPVVTAPAPAATPVPEPSQPATVAPAPVTPVPEPVVTPPVVTPPAPQPEPIVTPPVVTAPAPAATPVPEPSPEPTAEVTSPTLSELEALTTGQEQATVDAQINEFAVAPAPEPAVVEPSDTPIPVAEAEPVVTPPEPAEAANTAANDTTMANAVESLSDANVDTTVIAPTEPIAAPEPAVEPTLATPSNTDGRGKKIIAPLDTPEGKPDLAALLAIEEAKENGTDPVKPSAATLSTPPTPPATPGQEPFDPNSIAL
ncbi:MAG: sensor hybrid histidine kinase [Candidatus Saccharibacteria bacterium]|nr:sensor hybrid histidine kinase [Candidatus Saccharibacteria bacterium]